MKKIIIVKVQASVDNDFAERYFTEDPFEFYQENIIKKNDWETEDTWRMPQFDTIDRKDIRANWEKSGNMPYNHWCEYMIKVDEHLRLGEYWFKAIMEFFPSYSILQVEVISGRKIVQLSNMFINSK